MTINSHGCQGKNRHLNVPARRCAKVRITRHILQQDHGHFLFLGNPVAGMSVTKQQVTRIFLGKSDVSQLKGLYSGDDGESLAEAIRQNCCIWFPLQPGDTGHDA